MVKAEYQINIGGGFASQKPHKPKVVPRDFLAQFAIVNSENFGSIVDFANNYGFGGYLLPAEGETINGRFAKTQKRYRKLIEALLTDGTIKYADLLKVNADLSSTSPMLSLRDKASDLLKIEEGFAVYTMESFGDEKAMVRVVPIGSFDVDKKAAHMKVTIERPANSKAQWYYRRIADGVTRIQEIYPSDNWLVNEEFLDSIILTEGSMKLNEVGQPTSIEMIYRLGNTQFVKDKISAVWSPTTAESFIAKMIWDYFNSNHKETNYKLCKVCGDVYLVGKSPNHCSKTECKKEWDSKRHIK